MEKNTKQQGNIIAIITMMFLFAMISFVTNLAAPIGVIWKNVFDGTGSENMIGMLGNAMNFPLTSSWVFLLASYSPRLATRIQL